MYAENISKSMRSDCSVCVSAHAGHWDDYLLTLSLNSDVTPEFHVHVLLPKRNPWVLCTQRPTFISRLRGADALSSGYLYF